MNEELYTRLYRNLNKRGDVPEFAAMLGISESILFAILSQKIVRKTKRDYHGLKRQSSVLFEEWKRGKSLLKLSEERKFSPVLTASFILKENGITRKEFHDYLRNPHEIEDRRLRKEILEVLEEEVVYSPEAAEIQRENGKVAEQKIGAWLDSQGATYITEIEARELHRKTPDFLLKGSLLLEGNLLFWVESKASFGDRIQMRGDYNRQLKHYVDLFGRGLVIYWNGYVNDSDSVEKFLYDPNILIGNSLIVEGTHV